MQQLGRIEIFLEVAKNQSFAKAARALGITGPAVSKQVMALEEELGVKLLHRTTRLVTLTDEGMRYYDRAHHAVEELREAALDIQDRKTLPAGSLRINAPLSFGQMHLLPVLSGFAKKYPDLRLDVQLDDRMVDVIGDGFDVVIRVGSLVDSSLVSKHLAPCPIYFVASPEYLHLHGTPKHPPELLQHRVLAYSNHGVVNEWRLKGPNHKNVTVRSEGIFRSNNAEQLLQATLDGVGISMLPIFCVSTHLKAGKLVQLFSDYELTPPRSLVALMPPTRYRTAKVKLFLDWLSQACRAMPLG